MTCSEESQRFTSSHCQWVSNLPDMICQGVLDCRRHCQRHVNAAEVVLGDVQSKCRFEILSMLRIGLPSTRRRSTDSAFSIET